MLRKNERFLSRIYLFADFLVIQSAFVFSWWIRFAFFDDGVISIDFTTYFIWNMIYTIVALIFSATLGLYSSKRRKTFAFELFRIIQVHMFSLFVFMSILFTLKTIDVSRIYLLIFISVNILLSVIYRYIVKKGLKRLRKNGFNKRFILVLGAGRLGIQFYENVKKHPELGYEVIGFLDDFRDEINDINKGLAILGDLSKLEILLGQQLVDEVVVALPLYAHEKFHDIVMVCEKMGVKVLIIPDYYNFLPARPSIDTFGEMPLINVRDVPLDEIQFRFFKRTFDIVFSLFVLIVTSPLLLVMAIFVKLSSPGPVIFKQERVGLNRRTFYMYKFRSMKQLTIEEESIQWTTQNDPRKTWFGSFIRKTSLDELPQFINVLKGDMSVVGPRPERPYFVDKFKEEIPKYMIKHHVRPGITGWAQVNGLRGDTSIEDRIKHDIFYIENWTFLFDIKIILKTFISGLVNKNAY
jgi:Undecaprenyl-phosphate glucose phosphotransferase